LQCVAVCCSVLQCAAVCCSVLQCAAVCCSVLQCLKPIGWHKILRLFAETFMQDPGVKEFSWDLWLVPLYLPVLIVSPMGRILVRRQSFRNHLKILIYIHIYISIYIYIYICIFIYIYMCHPICSWLCVCLRLIHTCVCVCVWHDLFIWLIYLYQHHVTHTSTWHEWFICIQQMLLNPLILAHTLITFCTTTFLLPDCIFHLLPSIAHYYCSRQSWAVLIIYYWLINIDDLLQPIAFGVSFNLNLQSQSPWSLFNGSR